MKKIVVSIVFGVVLGSLFVPASVHAAAETTSLDRIASILDKLLDAVKDTSRRESKVECVCRCER